MNPLEWAQEVPFEGIRSTKSSVLVICSSNYIIFSQINNNLKIYIISILPLKYKKNTRTSPKLNYHKNPYTNFTFEEVIDFSHF